MSKIIIPEDLYQSFAQTHPELVSHISMDVLRKICRAEFALMKEVMIEGSLEEVRLQYLFVIRVSPQKVMKHLRLMAEHKQTISVERHAHYSDLILNHIRNNKNKFRKYEQRIRKYTGYTRGEIDRGEYIGNGYKCNT